MQEEQQLREAGSLVNENRDSYRPGNSSHSCFFLIGLILLLASLYFFVTGNLNTAQALLAGVLVMLVLAMVQGFLSRFTQGEHHKGN